MHWLVISKPSWGWDGAASSGATCRQPSHVFQGYFYLDHLLWRLSELVLDQAHRHEWTFCSWNRSHSNTAIQIVESNGNKSEICCSLHCDDFHVFLFKCTFFVDVHTHTDCKFVCCTVLDFKETLRVSVAPHPMLSRMPWSFLIVGRRGVHMLRPKELPRRFESSSVSWWFWNVLESLVTVRYEL